MGSNRRRRNGSSKTSSSQSDIEPVTYVTGVQELFRPLPTPLVRSSHEDLPLSPMRSRVVRAAARKPSDRMSSRSRKIVGRPAAAQMSPLASRDQPRRNHLSGMDAWRRPSLAVLSTSGGRNENDENSEIGGSDGCPAHPLVSARL